MLDCHLLQNFKVTSLSFNSSRLKLVTGEDISQAEKAVEHICFLADVNRLYEHALGLYDLELTLLVAQQSQKASQLSIVTPCPCTDSA